MLNRALGSTKQHLAYYYYEPGKSKLTPDCYTTVELNIRADGLLNRKLFIH